MHEPYFVIDLTAVVAYGGKREMDAVRENCAVYQFVLILCITRKTQGEYVMPRISVVLSSYNHERWIGEAIDSVLRQTFQDFELIILDDASTDRSWDIINSYDDPRIHTFRNKQRTAETVLKAVSDLAISEVIAVHHSDDVWEPNKLEKQIRILEARPELGAVFTWANIINDDGKAIKENIHQKIFAQPNRTRHEWLRYFLLRGNALCHPSVLIRKQCYRDCGLYRHGIWGIPDFDMWIRLCLKYEIHVIPEPLVRFRWHDDGSNTSARKNSSRNRSAFEFYLVLESYDRIDTIDDVLRILPEAEKHLGQTASDPGFVLAMTLLDIKHYGSMCLFAQKKLFDLISNPESAARIKEWHDFDYMDFMEITRYGPIFVDSASARKRKRKPFLNFEWVPGLIEFLGSWRRGRAKPGKADH
ncbi:MAG: glycosyltransferase [Candidatus Accumulibacter sp.]|jgi:glycosyltransferase involved in cell wall biosynthesis|nr:glycosyltransferase [Accumulibacter sp.]